MSIKVRLLKARHGDCILISHTKNESTFNLLIDGGTPTTFKHGTHLRYKGDLCLALDEIKSKNQVIDLAILTHIDDDHIGGLIRAFETPGYLKDLVKSIWFNSSKEITDYFEHPEIPENNIYLKDKSPETSPKQGKNLEILLREIECERPSIVMAGQVLEKGPFKFTILSPDESSLRKLLHIWPHEKDSPETSPKKQDHSIKFDEILSSDSFSEDTSDTNASSIAFIAEVDDKSMLFLGDAHDKTTVANLQSLGFSKLNKLNVDLVKVSHHGSKGNTSVKFLSMINSKRFLISTNGLRYALPDKRTIARILASTEDGKVYFNYDAVIKSLLLKEEKGLYSKRLCKIDEVIKI